MIEYNLDTFRFQHDDFRKCRSHETYVAHKPIMDSGKEQNEKEQAKRKSPQERG